MEIYILLVFLKMKKNNNKIYILTSNYYVGPDDNLKQPIKVFDLEGNKIKDINSSKGNNFYIDTYYDKKTDKYYITGDVTSLQLNSYLFEENKIYKKYWCPNYPIYSHIIVERENEILEKIVYLIEFTNCIRIWNFHTEDIIKTIDVDDQIYCGYFWNDEYLCIGCSHDGIKFVNIENGKIIKEIKCENPIHAIKVINHPQYGKCLISQCENSDNEGEGIKLWVIKNI